MEKKFYNVREAAEFCGMSPRLLYFKKKQREIRYYKIGSLIVFDVEDLIEFVKRNEFVTGEELLKQLEEKRK